MRIDFGRMDAPPPTIENAMRQIEADVARHAARSSCYEIDNSDEPLESTVDRILSIRR